MRSKSSLFVLGVRCLVLVGAATVTALGFVATGGEDRAGAALAPRYVCPMHPDVTATEPSDCSICGMALEPQDGRQSAPADEHEPVQAAAQPSAAAGPAASSRFSCPMHPDQSSDVPAKCRICKMPMTRSGQPAGEHEDHDHADPSSVSPRRGAAVFSFHDVSRVRPRASSRDMKAPAWVDGEGHGRALYFADEWQLLEPGERGLFFPTTKPEDGAPAGIEVQVAADPPAPWDGATKLVTFEVRSGQTLPAGRTGWLKLATRTRKDLAVPYSALIQSPEGPYVLVLSEDLNEVTKRMVTIGSVLFGYASVIAGLKDGERIAAMRTFSLDALRKQATP